MAATAYGATGDYRFSPEELQCMQSIWTVIAKKYSTRFAIDIFIKLFEVNQIYKVYFGIGDDAPETYPENGKLQALGVNVMYLLNMAFDNLADREMLDELVKKMVRSHKRRGVERHMFDDIVHPFDDMVKKTLGEITEVPIGPATFDTLHKAFVFLKTRIQELYNDAGFDSEA